jgi:hypothetical protein
MKLTFEAQPEAVIATSSLLNCWALRLVKSIKSAKRRPA